MPDEPLFPPDLASLSDDAESPSTRGWGVDPQPQQPTPVVPPLPPAPKNTVVPDEPPPPVAAATPPPPPPRQNDPHNGRHNGPPNGLQNGPPNGPPNGPQNGRKSGRLILVGLVALAVLGGVGFAVKWKTTPDSELTSELSPVPPSTPVDRPAVAAPQPSATAGDLVAADEFSGTKPDARWGIYDSTAPNGSKLSSSAVRVAGGELQVVGTGKNPTGQGNVSGGLCWCSAEGNRTYGRWELRARFDAGVGYGQTIGLWPQSDKGADGSMAFAVRGGDRKTTQGYVLWSKNGGGSDARNVSGDFTAWHTYTIEWRATFVKIMVDGKAFYDSTTSGGKAVIPAVPLHLYMQQTPGPHDGVAAPNATTPSQVIMHVDWVRIYR